MASRQSAENVVLRFQQKEAAEYDETLLLAFADVWSKRLVSKAVKVLPRQMMENMAQWLFEKHWFEVSSEIRMLQSPKSRWMSIDQWAKMATEICPRYNGFIVKKVAAVLSALPMRVEVAMARESSVALYLTGAGLETLDEAALEGLRKQVDASRIWFEPGGVNIHLWWG